MLTAWRVLRLLHTIPPAARPVSVGSLLPFSVRQPAVHGGRCGVIRPARANAVRLAARLHCPKRQQADGTLRPAALRFRTPGVRLKPCRSGRSLGSEFLFQNSFDPGKTWQERPQDERIELPENLEGTFPFGIRVAAFP